MTTPLTPETAMGPTPIYKLTASATAAVPQNPKKPTFSRGTENKHKH
ncbi:MAG TPA: hypothetical protein VJY36_03540 [Candidatus Bathyarchaeia archaeon]|nr:hypothetical protein [Candidatus Bathyarchaeia archaeon]